MYDLETVLNNKFMKQSMGRRAEKEGLTLEQYIEVENREAEERKKKKKKEYEQACKSTIQYKCNKCGTKWQKNGKEILDAFEHQNYRLQDYRFEGKVTSILHQTMRTNITICEKCRIFAEVNALIPPKFHHLAVIPEKKKLLNENWNKNLFITGPVGTGKTVFACAVGRRRFENKKKFKFISYPSFIMELQSMFKREGESAYDRAEKIARFSGLLIIDDLGAEKLTDFVRQITYYLINDREQYQRPTAITSNFSLGEIDAQVDRRVSSRIAGMCKVLKFTGKDRRL